LYHSIDPD